MTLRVRLVGALVGLLTVGLGLFGVATYTLYSRSQYRQLDGQLRQAAPQVERQLDAEAFGYGTSPPPGSFIDGAGNGSTSNGSTSNGSTSNGSGSNGGGSNGSGTTVAADNGGGGNADGGGRGPGGGGGQGPGQFASPGTYGELVGSTGTVLAHVQLLSDSSAPDLTRAEETASASGTRLFTVGSESGDGRWRVLVSTSPSEAGASVVVAVPTSSVEHSLHEMVLIELLGALVLLALLVVGAWEVLRRGLLPLERMATTAGRIAGGDLTQRVDRAEDRSEVGRLGLALNTMLDEIETAFRQRRETEERLRQFLADVSHELRTPLTSIQGFAELFRLNTDQVDLPTVLRRIEQESGRMRLLVDDLLLLARLDQTREPELAPVDLTVLAADACSDARAVAPERAITLEAPQPVVVLGDQAHLRQALANLVTNALTHTPDGTAVEVEVDMAGGRALVSVRDHGPGLAGDALGHVFDRFWQADRSRAGRGAGLGLSIVSAIAAEHRGLASAENADGGGARFRLELPLSGARTTSEAGGGAQDALIEVPGTGGRLDS